MLRGTWVTVAAADCRPSRPPIPGSKSQRCILKELMLATEVFSPGGKEVSQGAMVAFQNVLYAPLPGRHLVGELC